MRHVGVNKKGSVVVVEKNQQLQFEVEVQKFVFVLSALLLVPQQDTLTEAPGGGPLEGLELTELVPARL